MTTLSDISFTMMDGSPASLGKFSGSVVLAVNVASKCGLTPQYEALEAIYEKYQDQGLVVLGFPANNFAGQEPGSNEEIASFCTANFGVKFPMAQKISVTGDDQHPLYQALTEQQPQSIRNDDGAFLEKLKSYGLAPASDTDVMWNFEKFLIGKDGAIVARFAPDIAPDDERVIHAVEEALKA